MRAYGKRKDRGPVPPLDLPALERLGLRYVERFATTRGKLADYFRRKLRERGTVEGFDADAIAPLVEKFARLGYVDDASWAGAKAGSLTRRGYGPRRVGDALRAAGIDADLAEAVAPDDDEAFSAAETYARKRKFGRFGEAAADRDVQRKQLAAMIRAGHAFDVARRLVEAAPDDDDDHLTA